ncbi:MAG: ATP-binding cassette domain-containing protein [Actinomycetia bacterium]|nr:ATP-binding cassette domain-containing protein [Actinomycetes bacterium]
MTAIQAGRESQQAGQESQTVVARSAGALGRPPFGIVRAGLVGVVASAFGVGLTAASGWLIVAASARPLLSVLMVAIIGVQSFGTFRPVARYLERLLAHDAALAELARRRTAVYRALIPLTPARLGRRGRGRVLGAVVHDLDDVVLAQVRVTVPLLEAGLCAVGAVALTAALFPAAVWALVGYVVVYALVTWRAWRIERSATGAVIAARGAVDRDCELLASNLTALQAIGATATVLARLERAQRDLAVATLRADRGRLLGIGAGPVLNGLATLGMALAMAGPVHAGTLRAPMAGMLVLLPVALGEVLGGLSDATSALARAEAAARRVTRLLDQPPAVAESTGPEPSGSELALTEVSASWDQSAVADHSEPGDRAAGSAAGDRVTGSRAGQRGGGGRHDLAALTATISPGDRVAITGPNGSGKSTLLAVLARQLDPAGGRYAIGGSPVGELGLEEARGAFAVVDDEPHVFAGTLRANLLLARPDAADEDVVAAVDRAGLADWLAELPDGLDTQLGEGGRGVSGGQRARLSVARAQLSERPVLILDEPVAHLDAATADAVLAGLARTAVDQTVLITSHQGRAVDWCDRALSTVTAEPEILA